MLIYAVADIHGRRDRIALIRSKILKHKPDVLVVAHPPPRGTLDEVFGRFHSGCRSLQKIVVNKQPRLLICGHVHERPGTLFVGETLVVNCSMGRKGAGILINLDKGMPPEAEII